DVSVAPDNGATIVFEGNNPMVLQCYDQPPFPQFKEGTFWIGDIDDIETYTYLPAGADPGISIYDTLKVGVVQDPSWYTFRGLDTSGNPTGVPGAAPFYLTGLDLTGYSTLARSALPGDSSVTV